MYQIARNAAADARGHGQHEILLENAALDELHDERNGAAESLHTQHELERRLQRALLRLPGDKRELVLLSRVKELGTADLARLFGCSNSALKVRLHRSLTLLREFFDDGDTNP
jgi:RNA polymerase sigma-70 factor (ECF subfamily)